MIPIHTLPFHLISIRFISMFSSHLCLGIPKRHLNYRISYQTFVTINTKSKERIERRAEEEARRKDGIKRTNKFCYTVAYHHVF
jgi:hypothetical protein